MPSRNFSKTAVFILLVFAGWFFLFERKKEAEIPITYKQSGLITTSATEMSNAGDTSQFENYTNFPPDKNTLEKNYLEIGDNAVSTSSIGVLTDEQSSNPSFVKQYGLSIKEALMPYTNADRKSEIELLLTAFKTRTIASTTKEMADLRELAAEHNSITEKLFALRAPINAREIHLNLVNVIARLGQLTTNMSNAGSDPIKAALSAQEFATEYRNLLSSYQKINDYFLSSGITFADNERAKLVIYEIN